MKKFPNRANSSMASTDSSSVRLCLKSLAHCTLEVIREMGNTTSEDLATVIISKFLRAQPNLTGQDTIRRRIYDVINVLSATGVIEKSGKQLVFRGYKAVPGGKFMQPQSSENEARIATKEKILRDKISLLVLYKALLKRNYARGQPPPDAVHLPAIVVGIRDLDKSSMVSVMNGLELKIEASQRDLLFLAPSDILKKMRKDFPDEVIRSFLEEAPELVRYYGTQLFEDRNL